jgi:hypothetical protein
MEAVTQVTIVAQAAQKDLIIGIIVPKAPEEILRGLNDFGGHRCYRPLAEKLRKNRLAGDLSPDAATSSPSP